MRLLVVPLVYLWLSLVPRCGLEVPRAWHLGILGVAHLVPDLMGGVAAEQPLVHFQAVPAGGPVVAVDGEEHPELGVRYPVVESGWGALAWWVEVEGGPGIAHECFA